MKVAFFVSITLAIAGIIFMNYHKPTYTSYFCPNSESLKEGFVYTNSLRNVDLELPYRRLEGPFIARKTLSGRSISYAGLFTHKYWSNGKLIQYEEPTSDTLELLKFEVGTQHEIKTIRYNPQEPDRKWHLNTNYNIENTRVLEVGSCSYSGVSINIEQTIRYPDGKVKTNSNNIVYIPELMIATNSKGPAKVNVTKVRTKESHEKKWPFTPDAYSWLHKQ